MGNKSLIGLMEKLEKGETLPDKEKAFVLDKIQEYLEEVETLRKEFDEN
jgi:ribosome assembly protein YihI (activator of Der GTPase)